MGGDNGGGFRNSNMDTYRPPRDDSGGNSGRSCQDVNITNNHKERRGYAIERFGRGGSGGSDENQRYRRDGYGDPGNGGGGGGRGPRGNYYELWECSECRWRNHPGDSRCSRCGFADEGRYSHPRYPGRGAGGASYDDGRRRGGPDNGGESDVRDRDGGTGRGYHHRRGRHDPDDQHHRHRSRNRHRDDRGKDSPSADYYGPPSSGGGSHGPDGYNSGSGGSGDGYPQLRPPRRDRRSGSGDRREDMDEFGRSARKHQTDRGSSTKNTKSIKEPREWPPCFEMAGSAYVFDTRSAMFYEAESDFFYDPKSKLYYGNKKGAYYRHKRDERTGRSSFEMVQKQDGAAASAGTSAGTEARATASSGGVGVDPEPIVTNHMPTASSSTAPKPAKGLISINLKSKTIGKKGASDDKTQKSKKPSQKATPTTATHQDHAPGVLPPLQKKHAADMEKWSERQAEKQHEQQQGVGAMSVPSGDFDEDKVARTVKGEPICLLCKRKFPSLEKLAYHKQASNLHKENLARLQKQRAAANTSGPNKATKRKAPEEPTSEYVDRAQQRRIMYGPETLPQPVPSLPAPEGGVVATEEQARAAPTRPEDNLGESNIGNRMLQKLGWKQGSSLGRQAGEPGGGGDDAAAVTGRENDAAGDINDKQHQLVRDWKRIESIAGSNGGMGQSRTSAGVGLH